MSSCPRQAQAPPPGVSSPFVLVAGGTPFPSLDLLPEQPVCLSPAGLPLVSPAKDFCQGEGSRGISRLQEGSLPGVSRPGVAGGRLPSASPWHSPPGAQLATARNWGGGGGSKRSHTPSAHSSCSVKIAVGLAEERDPRKVMASHLLLFTRLLSLHYAGLWSPGTQVLVRTHHHNVRGCHEEGSWVLLKAYQITGVISGPFSG